MYKENYVQKLIEQFAADDQNRIALKLYNGKQTEDICYTKLAENILSAAGFLKKDGRSGQHVALMGANSQEWLCAFLAIVASGNIAVPLNHALPVEMLMEQCRQADVTVICGDSRFIPGFSDMYPCIPYDVLWQNQPMLPEEIVCPDPDVTAVLLFTSGTTGKSKVVELSHANIESSLKSSDGIFAEPEINRIMTVLPMFHIAGIRGTLAMLCRFKTLCIGRGIMYLFRDMPILMPDYILLVPLMVESLVKIMRRTSALDLREKYIGSNLKRICVGGATIDPENCRYLMEQGFVIDSGYALSETTGVGTWGKWDEKHFNTIGKSSDELQCRIVEGELQFKGAAVMKGYYKDPEATGMVIKDGWLQTGDLGCDDSEGFYYLTGRKKNLIVMANGEKLNPEEMEKHFENCDAIEECRIWYNEQDHVLCMDVYTHRAEDVRKDIAEYNEKMPLSNHIRRVVFRDAPLERTASGKLVRKEQK